MREGVVCPEACLFSVCLNCSIKYFIFLCKPNFFKFTCIKQSHIVECLFLVSLVCQEAFVLTFTFLSAQSI